MPETLSLHDQRLSEVENELNSLNDWAGELAGKADPEELWGNLSEKEARISELESQMEQLRSSCSPGACAGLYGTEEETISTRIDKLEQWITEMSEDADHEVRLDRSERIIKSGNPAGPKTGEHATKDRKPILEHKAVQNITGMEHQVC